MMDNDTQKILSNLTILYIEDEDNIRKSMEQTLNMLFFKVITFDNAEDALEYCKLNLPDIILSDINLPNMSGIEFSKIIRENNHNIPIILLTAYTNTDILLEATKLKLINYLIKPVVFEELNKSLKIAVQDILRTTSHILKLTNGTIYNLSTKLLYKNNIEVNLTSSENRLLGIFIKYKNKTITTDEIKNLLWNDPYNATDSALKSALNKLRSKIGKDSIKNVSGIGYHLVASYDFSQNT